MVTAQKSIFDHTKNNTCRILYIENYRNVGVNAQTHITINRSIAKGEMGGLIFLVGPNNSGKSNILDAIQSLSDGISDRDFTFYPHSEESVSPNVTLRMFDTDQVCIINCKPRISNPDLDWKSERYENLYQVLVRIKNKFNSKNMLSSEQKDKYSSLSGNELKFIDLINQKIDRIWLENNGFSKEDCDLYENVVNELYQVDVDNPTDFEFKYGFKPRPLIIRYRQSSVTDTDCTGKIGAYGFFLKNLMAYLFEEDLQKFELLTTHDRDSLEEDEYSQLLNLARSKLVVLNKRFNVLYQMNSLEYKFDIKVDANIISFKIYLGEIEQKLEYSSTGFRWFFDFYFNFLYYRPLNRGDIIIMDEPALNLHVRSQQELTKILREFATRNDVTFVISTHSPFMIDLDYLDEVRIVVRGLNGITHIIDNFQEGNKESPDSLRPILDALTVERHTLLDPSSKIFFVEGVTDYYIFNAFKKMYGKDRFHFLPVEGLGNTKDNAHRNQIISCLKEIDPEPILIVDGDYAGSQMSFAKEKGIQVVSLAEIGDGKECLEKMFETDEYSDLLQRKETNNYCVFRHHVEEKYESLSTETKENFRLLFNELEKTLEYSKINTESTADFIRGYVERTNLPSERIHLKVTEITVASGRINAKIYGNNYAHGFEFKNPLKPVPDMLDSLDTFLSFVRNYCTMKDQLT